jgi:hypothetical protein
LGVILTNTSVNIPEIIDSDKFDVSTTSSLSLFLFEHKAILFAKDPNGKIAAIHQVQSEHGKTLIEKTKEDILYQKDVPTQVFVHQEHLSLVPGMLFDPAFASTYLFLSGDKSLDKQVFHTGLESNNYHLLGSLDKMDYENLIQKKSDIKFNHGACSFLSYGLKEKPNLVNQELLVMLFDKHFYIAAYNQHELVLFNSFGIESKENLLQYLFGINHQLKFNRNHCRVSIFGEWEKLGLTSEWGNEYFRNFRITEPNRNVQYLDGLEIFKDSQVFEAFWQFQP